jgi:hypothetical protein
MNLVRLLPVLLSSLLLAAHFFRFGHLFLVLLSLIFPALLWIRKRWAVRVVQGILVIGSIEWLRTLLVFVNIRIAVGEPWVRLVLILGTVAALTLASTFVFRLPALKKRYSH